MLKYSSLNLKYRVGYEPLGFYSCSKYGCYSDGICRCFQITGVNVSLHSLYRYLELIEVLETSEDPLDLALSLRFLMQELKPECFTASWSHNYYGDEVDSILLEGPILKRFELWNGLSNINKVKLLLTQEYGFVLDELKEHDQVSLQSLSVKKIVPSANDNLDEERLDFYREYYDYEWMQRLGEKFYPGIIVKQDGDGYKLIDGRHRLALHLKHKRRKIQAIVLSEQT